jgi:CRP-like cAMP-binding protein
VSAVDWIPDEITAAGRQRTLQAGESLFRQGDQTYGVFAIVKGRVQMMRPSPQIPSMTPGMQHGDMMKMLPQMSQMMDGCIQMMKSHMQQPAGPSPKPDPEHKG